MGFLHVDFLLEYFIWEKLVSLSDYKKGKKKHEANFITIVFHLYESKNPVLVLVDYLLSRVPPFSLSLEAIFAISWVTVLSYKMEASKKSSGFGISFSASETNYSSVSGTLLMCPFKNGSA